MSKTSTPPQENTIKSNRYIPEYNGVPLAVFGTYTMHGELLKKMMKAAVKAGYRYFDTAASYENEKDVGKAIKEIIEDGLVERKDLFISTKLSPFICIGYNETIKAFNESLDKLGLDYLDMYLIHWPNNTPNEMWKKLNAETWRAMEDLKTQGKIRYIGVSNFGVHHLQELLKTAKVKPFVNQIEFSPYWQQSDVVDFCKSNGILCESYQSIASLSQSHNISLIEELAKKYGKSIQQIVMKYCYQKGLAVLARSDREEYIEANLDVFDFSISDNDMKLLDELNSNPNNNLPDNIHWVWSMIENIESEVKSTVFKLFNFIPFLNVKYFYKYSNLKKKNIYLLRFIPLLKIKYKSEKSASCYLFGFIKIGKIVHKIEKPTLVPKYTKEQIQKYS